MLHTLLSILLQFCAFALALAAPDRPYAIAASSYGPIQASLINNDIQSFLATETAASAFRAAVTAFAAITDFGLVHDYRGDPNQLAMEYFTATATPTWWPELPSPLQTYIEQVGNAQASIESSDAALSVNETPATSTGPAPAASRTKSSDGRAVRKWDDRGTFGMGLAMAAGALGVALL